MTRVLRVIGLIFAAVLWLAVGLAGGGCGQVKEVGGDVGGTVAEFVVCPIDLVNCGHVYLCAEPADNALGHIEICVDDDDSLADVEAVYGMCVPTPRHEGLCIVCCGSDCGRGANAFNGTWCP